MTTSPLQKLKASLKPILKNPEAAHLIAKRIKENHGFLMEFKKGYENDILHKCLVHHTQTEHMPRWVNNILPLLERYLDVHISEVSYLFDNKVDPTKTLVVIGNKDQTLLVRHYLNFIVPTVDACVNAYKERCETKAKEIRELIRLGVMDESERMDDSRSLSSVYRLEIIELIQSTLKGLLEYQAHYFPQVDRLAQIHRETVKAKIKNKNIKVYG